MAAYLRNKLYVLYMYSKPSIINQPNNQSTEHITLNHIYHTGISHVMAANQQRL